MNKNKFVLEDANDLFLENLAKEISTFNNNGETVNISENAYKSTLYAACVIASGSKWYMELVNKVVSEIENSFCLANIDNKNIDLVRNTIVGAGFTLNQANLYIEKKYGIDTDYSVLGFVRDSMDSEDKVRKGGH